MFEISSLQVLAINYHYSTPIICIAYMYDQMRPYSLHKSNHVKIPDFGTQLIAYYIIINQTIGIRQAFKPQKNKKITKFFNNFSNFEFDESKLKTNSQN